MKIRMLVDGHTEQQYDFEFGQKILAAEIKNGNMVVDDETKQLTKIDGLKADSDYTVYPRIVGG